MSARRPAHLLAVLVFAQLAGTALWFAPNAVLADLRQQMDLPESALSSLTSAVQFGFLSGTLLFAITNLADRYSARHLFAICACAGAASNALPLIVEARLTELFISRFATGFCLAGIYPVGMKLAASWYSRGLGWALGCLVGALVLGTAFPHGLQAWQWDLAWQDVLGVVSVLCLFGGGILWLTVRDGPHLPTRARFDPRVLRDLFAKHDFRAAACGYFGHMWELYAFWAFAPVFLTAALESGQEDPSIISRWAFLSIASGSLGCVSGGILAQRCGNATVATWMLATSGSCALTAPLWFEASPWLLLPIFALWGFSVVADSPQLSALSAATAPKARVGSALALTASLGYLITIGSIQLLDRLRTEIPIAYLPWVLVPGPLFGWLALRRLRAAERLARIPSTK